MLFKSGNFQKLKFPNFSHEIGKVGNTDKYQKNHISQERKEKYPRR